MIKCVFTSSDTIHALHSSGDGLWIAHQGGVTHFDVRRGVASKWTTGDGLPALPVLAVATDAERVAVATPNGVAWSRDAAALVRDAASRRRRLRWERGLTHPEGAGVFAHGIAFVRGRIYATTGGGRLYRHAEPGFERVQLPLGHARLTRIVGLPTGGDRRRIVVLTNNSGVLLLATGSGEEPSLYQWSEDEGLQSRYATAIVLTGGHIVVGVRGALHVAPIDALVERPERWERWGRIHLDETATPGEGIRIAALCEHTDALWIGTGHGLHRLPLAQLGEAASSGAAATRCDSTAVRHLASAAGELWIAQGNALGRAALPAALAAPAATEAHGSLRERLFRGRSGRAIERDASESLSHAALFDPDPRWRDPTSEPECRRFTALATTPAGLVAGGEGGRVAWFHDRGWTTDVVARLRRPPEVHALAWDGDDATLWAATRFGLYESDSPGRWLRDARFPGRTVHALCAWSGSIAALGTGGLHVLAQGEWVEVSFGERQPLSVCAASDGALAVWGRGRFFVWRAGAPRPEPIDSVPGRATCMTWGDAGELWVGTDRGLLCWDGTRWTRHAWNDERRDRISAIVVHRGTLVVGSQAGLFMAPALEARRTEDARGLEAAGRRAGLLDGLPDTTVTAVCVHDARVYAGTLAGLVMLE